MTALRYDDAVVRANHFLDKFALTHKQYVASRVKILLLPYVPRVV
jgi:hypothetical protein